MKALTDGLVIRFSALILLLGSASIVLAQPPGGPATLTMLGSPVELSVAAAQAPPPAWGTSSASILNVNAWAFDHADPNAVANVWNHGARYISSGNPEWIAGFSLPTGAVVLGIEVQGCDQSSVSQLTVALWRQYIPGGTETNALVGGTALTTGLLATPGCGSLLKVLTPEIISNEGQSYFIDVMHLGALDGSVRFQAVRIYYTLVVSPAPAVATFTDVPTSYWAFQYIEALAASGITVGVTPTTYEPESNVTRAQMAVFLAKALGLHWPN